MIAYNYCYSTCLGRIKDFEGRNKFGVVDLDQPPGLLASLSDHIHGELESYVSLRLSHISSKLPQMGWFM